MDPLGKPLTGKEDEDGAGIGLSGGHGKPTSTNSQAGMMAEEERQGFNAGVGRGHASGGIPHFHQQIPQDQSTTTPIADKFMTGGAEATDAGVGGGADGLSGGKLDNSLDNYGGEADNFTSSNQFSGDNFASGQTVSGAYEGGNATNALTGQSRAVNTGPGVGYDGSNLESSDSGLAAGAAGLTAGGVAGYGTGVGASGGAGAHYDDNSTGTGTGGGTGSGNGADATDGAAQGHYGTTEKDFDRGAPLSDPKEIDSGGPHSLIMDPATGKYVHRHEREGGALQDK